MSRIGWAFGLLLAGVLAGCGGTETGGDCTDVCVQGSTMCSGSGVMNCSVRANGCTGWGSPIACPGGQSCNPATNLCGASGPGTTAGPTTVGVGSRCDGVTTVCGSGATCLTGSDSNSYCYQSCYDDYGCSRSERCTRLTDGVTLVCLPDQCYSCMSYEFCENNGCELDLSKNYSVTIGRVAVVGTNWDGGASGPDLRVCIKSFAPGGVWQCTGEASDTSVAVFNKKTSIKGTDLMGYAVQFDVDDIDLSYNDAIGSFTYQFDVIDFDTMFVEKRLSSPSPYIESLSYTLEPAP